MEIRRADLNDLDMLVDNRLEFVCFIRDIANEHEFRINTREYLKKHLEDGSLLAFIAVENGEVVSSCILCIYETLPVPSCLSGRAGLLLNVYTIKSYRKQGLAYNLLTKLINEAKLAGVGKIQLSYTEDGYPLYKKIGFKNLDSEMVLSL